MRLVRLFVVLLFSVVGTAISRPALAGGHLPPIGPVEPLVNIETVPWFGVEGIAMSPRNELFIGSAYEGEIHRVTPDGEVSLFADLVANPDDGYLLGLAADAHGNVYGAVVGCNAPINGVWRVDALGESALVMPMPSAGCWASIPNALSFDEDGNLYATESAGGAVWRLGRDGDVTLWAEDELLRPLSTFGVNGITYRKNALWLLNGEIGAIVRIPIGPGGDAEPAEIFLQSDQLLGGMDGAQFDVRGNLYVGMVWTGELLRVSPSGTIEVLVTAEQFNGFYWPTNPVFGFGPERTTLYISGGNPSVVKVDVGIPGMLMPQFKRTCTHRPRIVSSPR